MRLNVQGLVDSKWIDEMVGSILQNRVSKWVQSACELHQRDSRDSGDVKIAGVPMPEGSIYLDTEFLLLCNKTKSDKVLNYF